LPGHQAFQYHAAFSVNSRSALFRTRRRLGTGIFRRYYRWKAAHPARRGPLASHLLWSQFQQGLSAIERVFALIDSDNTIIQKDDRSADYLTGQIEFKNVNFKYTEDQDMVLRNLSFVVEKGAKVGVVGSSGAGKSTIGELLLRFYDPLEGSVCVDGINIKELDVHQWRRLIGVVSQDIFLFNDTVKANIAFANPEVTVEGIEQAARRAYAHDFIKELPQGYDTFVGDRGVLLSGGQKQRIAIARAILNEPEILLFDEATSALDTQSEEIVQKTLDDISRNKTVITIAHRLSTVSDSDKILVIDKGEIIQQGSHQELLGQKNGLYSQLVAMQNLEPHESLKTILE